MTDGTKPTFKADAARQASASIAGIVYQVDQTILSWLDLPEGGALLLECGEDIDFIAPAITRDDYDFERLLVQVNRRSRNITLRRPEVVAALAHFAGHRKRNPDQRLKFSYLTTARVAREEPRLFDDNAAGIETWNAIAADIESNGPRLVLPSTVFDGRAIRLFDDDRGPSKEDEAAVLSHVKGDPRYARRSAPLTCPARDCGL